MYQSDTRSPSERARRAVIACLAVLLLALAGLDAVIWRRRAVYDAEIRRLRASMSGVERRRADEAIAAEDNRMRVAVALLRRQARVEPALHLVVAVDSSTMYLERDGALLRSMRIVVGPERTIGTPPDTVRVAPPRGIRTIERILDANDAWEVPEWIYAERGDSIPTARAVPGALGPIAIVLDGGTIMYAQPANGPLGDSSFVLPGAVRAQAQDLSAIAPSLTPGTRVYFY
jgi:hypothetical protein